MPILVRSLQRGDNRVGCVGILVDAKQDAVSFYERFYFRVLNEVVEGAIKDFPRSIPMFLSIKSVPTRQ